MSIKFITDDGWYNYSYAGFTRLAAWFEWFKEFLRIKKVTEKWLFRVSFLLINSSCDKYTFCDEL